MTKRINGKKIAILATDGYEQVELTDPKRNLERAGAKVEVLSIKPGKIKGWDRTDWGKSVKVDHLVNEVKPTTTPSSSPAARSTPTSSAPTKTPSPSSSSS